ncbi:MAG: hypothetical protein NZ533_00645 [Casimicrobiaceae bacterium]|nr:hypothetical protein [Casimicrobiaceae bacterium]MDW8311970.1 hypothetical protein [Burkholderiales bacterium]
MDIGSVLNAMRDPAGVPAHPVVFQVLYVLTWIIHIAFVHLTLGAAALAIYAFHRRGDPEFWVPLSVAMTKVAKVGVSLLIVTGVAPLLFTQVIYDPQWYTSNILSASWAMGFILTLTIAYCLWFAFYFGNKPGAKRHIGVYAWLGLGLFLLDGLIMHALSYQQLFPERWMEWYAPGGVVDTSGRHLHAIDWPRFAFMIALSAPAIGLFLLAYAQYFSVRSDKPRHYLDRVRALGRQIALWGFGLSLMPLLAWQLGQPSQLGLLQHPVGWLLVLSIVAMTAWVARRPLDAQGYLPYAASLLVLGVLSLWREIIRVAHMRPHGYDIAQYPVHWDIPSGVLFVSTLLGIGGLVGGFYVTLLYRSGRVAGLFDANAERTTARLASWANIVLLAWITVFFAYGIVIWVRNSFL